MNHAVELLAAKIASRGARGKAAAPIHELGEHPEAGGPVNIYTGKYGPYVKWEKINATIPDTIEPADLTMAQAVDLIDERAMKAGKKKPGAKKARQEKARQEAAAKKAAARKRCKKPRRKRPSQEGRKAC